MSVPAHVEIYGSATHYDLLASATACFGVHLRESQIIMARQRGRSHQVVKTRQPNKLVASLSLWGVFCVLLLDLSGRDFRTPIG